MKKVLTIPHWRVWMVMQATRETAFADWTGMWAALERRVFGFELAPPRRCE